MYAVNVNRDNITVTNFHIITAQAQARSISLIGTLLLLPDDDNDDKAKLHNLEGNVVSFE